MEETVKTPSFTAHVTTTPSFAGRTIANTAYVTAGNAAPDADSARFIVAGGFHVYLPLVLRDP